MYTHETKPWHRLVALFLSFVLVLGMLPANVVRAEEISGQELTDEIDETVTPGTVEAVPSVGTVDGSNVSFSGVTLDTADAESGWQIGAKVTAPEGVAPESALISGECTLEGNAVLLSAVLTKDAAVSGEQLSISWEIDWNADGVADQTVVVSADPASLVLTENGTEVFPAPYGVGTVTGVLENAEGVLETFATANSVADFSGMTLDWKDIDEAKGRTTAGWWMGVRVEAPAGLDQAALELAQCGPKSGTKDSFWNQKDADGNYLTFWCLVNENFLANYNPLSYTWVFDWNGDGYFEQTVKATVDPANVTLVKNGVKVYPTVTVTAAIEGNGTVTVNGTVLTDGQSVDVVKGEAVTVAATPADSNTRVGSVTIDDVAFEGESYTFTADANIQVSFVTEYTVTFTAPEGTAFTDSEGSELTSLTVSPDGETQFEFSGLKEGYSLVVKDNGTEMTAVDGVYTISNINEDHAVEAVVTDITAPVISNVSVSNPGVWTQSKTITITASDNSGAAVTYYISTSENADVNALTPVGATYTIAEAIGTAGVTYYVFAKDAAGNVSEAASVVVDCIDVTSPVFSDYDRKVNHVLLVIPTNVTYSFKVSDSESGIARVWYSTDSSGANGTDVALNGDTYSFTVDRNETYYIFAENGVGKIVCYDSNGDTVDVMDEAEPIISEVNYNRNNQKDEITVTFKAQDYVKEGVVTTGIAAAYYSTSSQYDEATATLITDPDPDNTDVTAKKEYTFQISENGIYYIHVVDNSGNVATSNAFKIENIDNKAPEFSVSMTTKDGDYDGSWTNQNVTVKINASDDLSGVKAVYYSTTEPDMSGDEVPTGDKTNSKDGAYTFSVKDACDVTYYIWAVDNFDHVSAVQTVTVKIDKTAPKMTSAIYTDAPVNSYIYNQGQYTVLTYNGTVNMEAAAEDDSCGVDHYEYRTCKLNGQPGEWTEFAGSYTNTDFLGRIQVRAVDQAGNASEEIVVVYPDENNKYTRYEGENLCWIDMKGSGKVTPELAVETVDGAGNVVADYDEEWTNLNVSFTIGGNLVAGVDHYEYKVDNGDWITMDGNVLTIEENTNASYTFHAVFENGESSGNIGPVKVKVWKTAPAEAQMTINGTIGDNGWYTTEPVITVTAAATEENGPDVTTSYTIYQNGAAEGEYVKVQGATAVENEHNDGQYIIKIRTEDAAGNVTTSFSLVTTTVEVDADGNEVTNTTTESKDSLAFNVDTTAPTELTITYTYPKVKKDENGNDVLDADGNLVYETDEDGNTVYVTVDLKDDDDETYFGGDLVYNKTITIELGANFDVSGPGSIKYLIVPNYGKYIENKDSYENNLGLWTDYDGGIEIKPNEKFVLIFRAEDAAGNVSYVHSEGIIVDDEAPSADENKKPDVDDAAVIFNIPKADGENGFYVDKEGFVIDITVFDPVISEDLLGGDDNNASGLASIAYILETVEETNLSQSGSIAIDKTETDPLIFKQTGKIEVDAAYFDGYTVVLKVIATDNAGNSKTFTSEGMKIDITKPQINIEYDNNNPANGIYYNAQRIATITVTERNFDEELVVWTVQTLQGTDYKDFTIPEKWFKDNGLTGRWEEGENDKWTLKIPFVDDNDYKFVISMKDMAGWDNKPITYGTDASTEDNFNSHSFTIDKTLPVISVTYDNNAAVNETYFNAQRVATVTVVEHNFDNQNTTITIGATLDGQAIQVPAWTFAHAGGDNWVARVAFENDGDYTFAVSATDKAGNSNEGVNYGASVAPEAFTIDTAAETPSVGGVEDGGSYTDEAKPSVDIYDVNYEGYTLTLERTNSNVVNEDVTEKFFELIQFVAPGGTLNTEDIPHEKENDGIYVLTVTIRDMAGNETTTVTTFTVNRFGSVYLPDDALRAATDGYHQSLETDLVMVEINPNKLVEGSTQVQITRDGKPLDIGEIVPATETANNEHGWYEYTYTLSKDIFTEDGVYKITFLSTDEMGNQSQSDTITFRVDKSVPELSSVVGLEDAIVNAQEHEVRYTVFDAIGIQSVEIWVDGEMVDQITKFDDPNNYTGSFVLSESNNAQEVKIVIRDLAGNILDTSAEDFTSAYEFNSKITVSTNWFVRWFANKPLFFGSLAGAGGLGWLLWFLIFGKRKKEEEEQAV